MTESTDPKGGEGQPSQQNQKEPGVFKPVEKDGRKPEETNGGNNNPQTPGNSVDGIRHPRKINLEEEKKKAVALEKATALLKNAQSIDSVAEKLFGQGVLEVIVSEMNDIKVALESNSPLTKEMEKAITEGEEELERIRAAIIKDAYTERATAIEQQNIFNKIEALYEKKERYLTLKPFTDLLQDTTSKGVPSQDRIILLYNELGWLVDFNKIKEFAKDNDVPKIQELEEKLQVLEGLINEAATYLGNQEQETTEEQKRIIEEGKKQTAEFSKLEEESSKLKILDTALTTLHAELKANAKHAEAEFYKSPSDVSLTKFDDALLNYTEILAKMKKKAVITVPSPTPEPSTPEDSEPQQAEDATSSDSETVPTGRTPLDINIPNISKDERARNLENSYKVKIDGKFITVPFILLGTLNRYISIFNNEEHKDKDFSKAIELKENVLNAIEIADFKLADDNARALGALLDTFEKKAKSTPEPEPTTPSLAPVPKPAVTKVITPTALEDGPSLDEDPEAYKKKVFWNTRVSTISLDGTKSWRIKKGDVYVKMSDKELAAWLPINDILSEYSSFVNSRDQAHDFPFLVEQKNELLDALEDTDFSRATELAKNLKREFDPMLDKENIPASEKTAARIQHEVRQYNLAQLANKDNLILNDDTSRFAFIKDPQSTTNREYRIIDKKTGEWVTLIKKDLVIMELVQSALTHFKNQTSKSPESIQKKNEILAYINDYDFEGAKEVAGEYLAEFSGSKKSPPLRPIVSGSEPSPAVKKAILSKTVIEELGRLNAIEKILNQSLPYLSSDLEKTAFTKLLQKQKALEESIKENPTPDLVNAFAKGNDFLVNELNKKKAYIEAQFGDITKSIPTELTNDTKIVRSARLRKADDAKETLGERTVRLKKEEGSTDIAQTRLVENKAELLEIHKSMFERNKTQYKEIYANENKVRDPITEAISTHTQADIATPPKDEEERRKTFLKNLVGLSPQEYLKELTVQEHDVMKKKQDLIANNMNGVTLENYDEVLSELDAQLLLIHEEKKKYTAAILSKFTKNEVAQKQALRQVYRPSQDDSIGDTTRGLGRNLEFNENNEVVKIDRENLTQEQIEDKFAHEVNPNDSQGIRPLQEKVNLSGSPYPNHTKGMSPLFNEEEEEGPQHGFSNADIETVRKQIEEEQTAKNLEEEQESKEKANEKLARVGKLFDSLVKKLKPTTTRQWFILGLATLGLATGTGVAFGKEVTKNGPEDKRLLDEYKKQPGWKNYLAEKVPEIFLKDFNGEGKLSYKELLAKYAPSFNINQSNPSAGDKLSSLLCKDVYFVIGANAGINEKQQVESSMLIDNLKEIMIAAKASLGTLYQEEAIQSGAIFGDMTIQQYYDVVSKEVEKADSERARLQAIKR